MEQEIIDKEIINLIIKKVANKIEEELRAKYIGTIIRIGDTIEISYRAKILDILG